MFAARTVLVPQRRNNIVLIRLLTCLLLLGAQTWFVGLHAVDLQAAIVDVGALPSEAEDQSEGPESDPDLGIAALQHWTLRSAFGLGSAQVAYEPDPERSGISLLPVEGLQPSAP